MNESFLGYVKQAFLFHWNLLIFGTVIALGLLANRADIIVPVAVALEVIYLAALATRPRFQAAVDGRNVTDSDAQLTHIPMQQVSRILQALSREDRVRYDKLKSLCLSMRRIVAQMCDEPDPSAITDMQMTSINRLLWIYLKLLYSKSALEAYFRTIDVDEIQAFIASASARLHALGPAEEDEPAKVARRKSLSDTIATSELRLKNHRVAVDNHELIGLELERLHSKIASLAEIGISRKDHNVITSEIDVIAQSVQQTEKALRELDFLVGFAQQDEQPPILLER